MGGERVVNLTYTLPSTLLERRIVHYGRRPAYKNKCVPVEMGKTSTMSSESQSLPVLEEKIVEPVV